MNLTKAKTQTKAQTKAKTRDMTEGSPVQLILGFAVPLLLGTLFQQFYSMVDTVIVGRYLGVNALAGVGSTGAVNFMINGLVIGICSGFAIPVSQQFGAKKYENMRDYVGNIIWLTCAFSLVLTAAVALLTGQILHWMRTSEDIYAYAFTYIHIVFLGIPVTFLYNMTSGLMRSVGDSRTPVLFLVLAAVMNMVLDYVSIIVLKMNVEGPALATVFSQGVSGLLCLFYIGARFDVLRVSGKNMRLRGQLCGNLCRIGIPMGLQYSITAIGSVVLQAAVNTLGAVTVASMAAAQKVTMFLACVYDALGATMATYAGQNVGAAKLDRVREGVLAAMKLGSAYAVLALLFAWFFGGRVAGFFVGADEAEVIRQAHIFMIVNAAFYIPLAAVNIYRFSIQGMGYSGFAVLAGVCEMAARALVGFAFVPRFGFLAACFASPLAWIFADAFLIPALSHCISVMRRSLDPSAV